MLRKPLAAAAAAVFSITLLSGMPAFSQEQLDAELSDKLVQLGIDTSVIGELTDEQVMEITNVVDGTDDEDTKRMEIETILSQ